MENSKIKYIAESAPAELVSYLESLGYTVKKVSPLEVLPAGIADHPDLRMCRMGIADEAVVLFADEDSLSAEYPGDVPFNAACTGKYLICNTDYVSKKIYAAAIMMGMRIVHVAQGYTKCSVVIVDEDSIITYDRGIAAACREYGMNVLLVEAGHCRLEGYNTGFIGGCSGRVGDEVVFAGDLSEHPDYEEMLHFIESRGLKCRFFDGPLTDIGSII